MTARRRPAAATPVAGEEPVVIEASKSAENAPAAEPTFSCATCTAETPLSAQRMLAGREVCRGCFCVAQAKPQLDELHRLHGKKRRYPHSSATDAQILRVRRRVTKICAAVLPPKEAASLIHVLFTLAEAVPTPAT